MPLNNKSDDEMFLEFAALVLSLNRKTFEAIVGLKSFQELLAHFGVQKIEKLDTLYYLQYSLIKHFLEDSIQSRISYFHNALNYLHQEGLLEQLSLEKLISLFDPSLFYETAEKEIVYESINENFHEEKQAIMADITVLKKLEQRDERFDDVATYLNSQKFSIGITGVMNAGKSTMLNALMGKEILGTNVIPETANLSIVKYAQEYGAKVVYWNKQEWRNIEHSAKSIDAMQRFLEQTRKHFKDNLKDYIQTTSRQERIDIEHLSKYTSASASEKRCNLVKYVELEAPLDFLQEDIEIVDTPGLDDVVVQREEITKEYLGACDVMLHLMNVSQSVTQKDIDFIIDAVLYQNISKVLIIITRVDLVSLKEVEEVIAYTKQSIARKLHEFNSDSQLDFLMKSLHFIALSGKMALLHKTGRAKEAEAAGYSLAQTGILDVQEYLQETLFGRNNARSELIIRSAKSRLFKAINRTLQELKYEYSLLFKSETEVDEELRLLNVKKAQHLEALQRITYQIDGYEVEVSNYLERLQRFLENEMKELQSVMKKRLMDETRYSLEKEKKTPSEAIQNRIIQSALKHGLIDIIREYRYKFVKKASKISEIITLQYDLQLSDENVYSGFDHKSVFGDAFKHGFLTSNHDVLVQKISKVIAHASASKLLKVDDEIGMIIKEEFVSLETELKAKACHLSELLLEEFFQNLKMPINLLENSLAYDEAMLQRHLAYFKENEAVRNTQSVELYERIAGIEAIAARYGL